MTAPCAGCQKSVTEIQPGNGLVGTELHSMLALLGIQADEQCDCESFAREMDSWGVDGCVARRHEIIAKLEHARSKTNWLQNLGAALFAIRSGVAAKLNPIDPIPGLVDEAIRRAARKIGRPDPQQVRRPHVNRHRSSSPVTLTPVPGSFSDVRNLMYHIWPTRKTKHWRWNVQQLLRRIDLFNGVRSIGVATDSETVSLAEVQAEFGDTRIDHWVERRNDPKCREGTTFLDLMRTMPHDASTTCYAHAKGVRHHAGSLTVDWAEMLYRTTLDHWQQVADVLKSFPIAGTFKRVGQFKLPGNHCWHYSGTFFWFRNQDVFSRPEWSRLHKHFFACVEAWPANVFTAGEGGVIFGGNAGNLYQPAELDLQSRALTEWESQCSGLK